MKVSDIWDIFGGLLMLALVAVVLTKNNTASDIQATGSAFSGAVKQSEAG